MPCRRVCAPRGGGRRLRAVPFTGRTPHWLAAWAGHHWAPSASHGGTRFPELFPLPLTLRLKTAHPLRSSSVVSGSEAVALQTSLAELLDETRGGVPGLAAEARTIVPLWPAEDALPTERPAGRHLCFSVQAEGPLGCFHLCWCPTAAFGNNEQTPIACPALYAHLCSGA